MRVKMENSQDWVSRSLKKKKKRIIFLLLTLTSFILITLCSLLYTKYQIQTGNIYPSGVLETEPGSETQKVLHTKEYDQIIRSPNLPYVMALPGKSLYESEQGCLFSYQDMYIGIYEMDKTDEMKDVLQSILQKENASVKTLSSYHTETGFLNGRSLQYQGTTMQTQTDTYYIVSYKFLDAREKDLLLLVADRHPKVSKLMDVLNTCFYSVYEIAPMEDGTDQVANITDASDESVQADTDSALSKEQLNEIDSAPGIGLHKIDESAPLVPFQEETVLVETDMETAYFVFQYTYSDREPDRIELYAPDKAEVFEPDMKNTLQPGMYVWRVDSPVKGEWTFRFTSSKQLGILVKYVESEQEFLANQQNLEIGSMNVPVDE